MYAVPIERVFFKSQEPKTQHIAFKVTSKISRISDSTYNSLENK